LIDSGYIRPENIPLEAAYLETGFCGTLRLLAVIPPLDSLGSEFPVRASGTTRNIPMDTYAQQTDYQN
jgi:hypothetical protein